MRLMSGNFAPMSANAVALRMQAVVILRSSAIAVPVAGNPADAASVRNVCFTISSVADRVVAIDVSRQLFFRRLCFCTDGAAPELLCQV